ncbi:MAG: hypothetical protein GY757_27590 [bacterium]|nr:hypothetical protein [bacterium]
MEPSHLKNICLFDIPGFECFQEICHQFDITITAHGGFVRRFVNAFLRAEHMRQLPDLFQLTSFGSDIDLIHSGTPDITGHVYESIMKNIYGAECFNWEVRSQHENKIFADALKYSNIIPANLMTISTNHNRSFSDSWNGVSDIKNIKYRFIRNGFYQESPLYLSSRDLEIVSVLKYLVLLCEFIPVQFSIQEQPGFDEISEIVSEASSLSNIATLQESAFLRAKLLYLFKQIYSCCLAPDFYNKIVKQVGLNRFLCNLKPHLGLLIERIEKIGKEPGAVLVSSSRIAGELYRMPHFVTGWKNGIDCIADFNETLNGFNKFQNNLGGPVFVASAQEVLLSSPPIEITPGTCKSDCSGESEDDSYRNELVHLAIPLFGSLADMIQRFQEEELTLLFVLCGENIAGEQRCFFFPISASCSISPCYPGLPDNLTEKRLLLVIRGNFLKILEKSDRILQEMKVESKPMIKFFLLGLTGGKE